MATEIITNIADMIKDVDKVIEAQKKATSLTVNELAKQAQTSIAKNVIETFNLKSAEVKDVIKIKSSFKDQTTIRASLKIKSKRIAIYKISGVKQTADGITFQIKKGNRKTIKGAFIAIMKNGHAGVYQRTGIERIKKVKNGKTYYSTLPIKELFTISITEMATSKDSDIILNALVDEKAMKIFQHNFEYFLHKI